MKIKTQSSSTRFKQALVSVSRSTPFKLLLVTGISAVVAAVTVRVTKSE